MKEIKFIMIVLCTIVTISCQSDAAKADKLWLNNEFGKASELYKKAANEDDAYAMWRLSIAYNNGDGVEYDEEMALNLLKRAANAGCPEAECDLALAYMFNEFGIGEDKEKGKAMMDALVERTDNPFVMTCYAGLLLDGCAPYEEDKDRAYEILYNIKDKKNPMYLRTMALVYRNGTSKTNPNIDKAIDYFKKAFKNGNRSSAFNLYLDYIIGFEGLKADTAAAIDWLQKGIDANQTNCMLAMSWICFSEDSSFQKYHNISRGMELLKSAAKHGSSKAYQLLGNEFYSGEHVGKDDNKAFDYTKKAADMRNANGAYSLGWYYINGTGCEKDIERGIEIWKKAVEYGNAGAANNLFCYYHGGAEGIPSGPEDKELAKEYLLKAANLGDAIGCWNLGKYYYWGSDLFEKNDQLAFFYTKKAADAGIVDACGALAYCYREGIGCDKNPDKAKEYENMTKAKEDLEKEH